ncbi:class I SAM-dependent DNA methyltransferase [Chryseobacterium viscerum]|uniref:site-specific DNA-methyltransferase (adenine-specific) n=1 Tax=Chryseobacterium viscerum TaxID=1037377 RepID=A0A5N4BSR8_9FLAO|nr:class I SAM-dependent DNA methyltransferase [Chryseobacterium viscerum]KAB1231420.1 SAM-dependent DNA methyltransferase [Chryseobacterium viscerum]
MSTSTIAQKIWSYCDTLRDDGLGYNDYLEQLTYLLFLKMADENKSKYNLPAICNWKELVSNSGGPLLEQYEQVLKTLADSGGMLGKIFVNAQNKIHDSVKLRRLLQLIDEDNWSSTDSDVKGEIYETLLQKNAENSGAGQYFTPRPVIQAMVECINPIPGETIADPSCGTGGFFLGALNHIHEHNELLENEENFLKFDTFHGWEIEKATARLCLMNLYLHGVGDLQKTPDIQVSDSLNPIKVNKEVPKVKIVLANPPFGKSSSDIPTTDENQAKKEGYFLRKDFWVTTSNKQLAFLQHIVAMLEDNGRAAVVLPDNVLFEGGAGEIIRKKMLEEANLHTILRLPTGIFYAQGVKSNVLFFEKKKDDDIIGTKEIWFYDYRTNVHHTPKNNPITFKHLSDFVKCYKVGNENKRIESWTADDINGRWRKYTYEEIIGRDKTNFDVFWLKDENTIDLDNLPDPELLIDDIIENIESALANFRTIKDSLN